MNYKTKTNQKNRFRSKFLMVAAAVVLLGAASYALLSGGPDSNDIIPAGSQTGATSSGSAPNKDKTSVGQTNPAPSTNKKAVEPVVTFAGVRNGNAEVRSYIAEVYESTGKCTATFTKGSVKITRTVEGIKDATYTRCDRVVVPVSEFNSSGGWSVTVAYSLPTAYGVSEASEINGL